MAPTKKPTAQPKNTKPAVDPDMPKGAEEIGGDIDEILQLSPGQSITGAYLGNKLTRSAFEGKNSTLHSFRIADGTVVGLWGSAGLDSKLSRIPEGAGAWVKYLGVENIEGGKTMHMYRVAKVDLRAVGAVGSAVSRARPSQSEARDEDDDLPF